MTSFDGKTLAQRFRQDWEKTNRFIGAHMQIADDKPPDPDATIILDLYNEHNAQPRYMMKRTFVETAKSYKCHLDILEPYDDTPWPWFIDARSLDLAIDRVLFMKVEYNHNGRKPCSIINTRSDKVVQIPPQRPHFYQTQKELESSDPLRRRCSFRILRFVKEDSEEMKDLMAEKEKEMEEAKEKFNEERRAWHGISNERLSSITDAHAAELPKQSEEQVQPMVRSCGASLDVPRDEEGWTVVSRKGSKRSLRH